LIFFISFIYEYYLFLILTFFNWICKNSGTFSPMVELCKKWHTLQMDEILETVCLYFE